MPFFSIIIPLYNKGAHIISTLESVNNQSYADYEIILITQKNHPSILSHMNQLHKTISSKESNFRLDSLINLHYVYENKIL